MTKRSGEIGLGWVVTGALSMAIAGCSDGDREALHATVEQSAVPCIGPGTQAAINAALVGNGAAAVLCPNAQFLLTAPVRFTAPNQQLYTQGFPTDSTRAVLRVNDAALTNAIN